MPLLAPITPHPQLTPSLNASGIENNQQEPGSCGPPNLCLTNHTKTLHAGRLPNNHSEESIRFIMEESVVYRAEITCCYSTSGCFSRLYPSHTDPIGHHCDWCSDRLHLVVVTSSPSCLFLSYSLDSLLLITILRPFALSSGLSFSFHLSPSPPPPPQPHMCNTVQHPPRPSPFSLSFTIPYPSTTRSTSKRFG